MEFFAGAFLFGFVRELFYASFIISYVFPKLPVKLLNVPIFIPIGWVFTFYLAHEFTDRLIQPKTIQDYKNFVIFTAFFSTFICIPIETAAMHMNWWWLVHCDPKDIIAPFHLIAGWFYTSVVFFCIYLSLKKKLPKEQLFFALFLLFFALALSFLYVSNYGWVGFVIEAIAVLGMLKYNKEITLILLAYFSTLISSALFLHIPNKIFIILIYTSIFICIFVKLYFMNAERQSGLENGKVS